MKKEQKGALGGGDNIIGAIAPPNFLELEFPMISGNFPGVYRNFIGFSLFP